MNVVDIIMVHLSSVASQLHGAFCINVCDFLNCLGIREQSFPTFDLNLPCNVVILLLIPK